MSKREMYLLILIGLGGLYVLFNLFMGGEKVQVKTVTDGELQAIEDKVNQKAKEVEFTDLELYKLEQAESAWNNNPFYDRVRDARIDASTEVNPDDPVPADALELTYTGFVDIDGARYAIINGLEYEVPDEMEEQPGIFLTRIEEDRIILGEMNSTNELVDRYFLMIEDDPLTIY